MRAIDDGREGVLPGNCNQMTGDGETVTPSLPEPGVWTGMAQANVWAPLRWKRAKIHRGSRRRILEAASRSRIYVSSCDCCTRSSQSVAIGRGPYTSTHDTKRTQTGLKSRSAALLPCAKHGRRWH
jgi:hypothetical protein